MTKTKLEELRQIILQSYIFMPTEAAENAAQAILDWHNKEIKKLKGEK